MSIRAGSELRVSWVLLCMALALTPLVITHVPIVAPAGFLLHGGSVLLKAVVSRCLVFAALALYAVAVARGAVGVRWHPVLWLGVALALWATVATAFSVAPGTALLGITTRQEGLLAILQYVAILFLVVQLADEPRRLRQLSWCILAGGAIVAVYGLLQAFGVEILQVSGAEWGARRASATIGNPDMFGAFMVLIACLALGATAAMRGALQRTSAAVVGGLAAAAAFLSYSRGAWLALVVAILVSMIIFALTRQRAGWREAAVFAAVLAFALLIALVPGAERTPDTQVAQRLISATDTGDANVSTRIETWRVAARSVVDRPIAGFGPDSFAIAYEQRKPESMASLLDPRLVQDSVHNMLLQTATDTGVVGVVILVALLGWTAVLSARMLRHRKGGDIVPLLAGAWTGVAGYLTAAQFAPSSISGSILFWALLGVLVSPSARPLPRRSPRSVWVWSAVATLAALAVAFTATHLVADRLAAIAQDRRGDLVQRLEAADDAVRLMPMSTQYHAIRAVAYMDAFVSATSETGSDPQSARFQFDESIASARRSAAIEPTSSRKHSQIATLLIVGGDLIGDGLYEQALVSARRGVTLAPWDLNAAYVLARVQTKLGKTKDAEKVLTRVLRTRPSYADAAILMSAIRQAEDDAAGAREVLVRTGLTETDPDVAAALRGIESY